MLVPTVFVANGNHCSKNVAPGLRLHHHFIRKHASVPVDVLKRASRGPAVISHPESGSANHIHFSVGIIWQAMTAGLVVRTGAFDRRIVLSNVEIEHPRTQDSRHTGERVVQYLLL